MGDIAVSVILPVRNQGDHIGKVGEMFRNALDELGRTYELIFVVNGSTDQTLELCKEMAGRFPQVKVVESQPGWGRSVKSGIAAARGGLICYTNSARTQPDDLLLILRYGLINDRMVVKASRKVRDSLLRRLGSVIYNFEGRMLFALAVWDVNGTPKAFPNAFTEALDLTEDGDLIDLEFVVKCKLKGIPIVEVPVYVTTRHGHRSTTGLKSAWRMYTGALRLSRRLK